MQPHLRVRHEEFPRRHQKDTMFCNKCTASTHLSCTIKGERRRKRPLPLRRIPVMTKLQIMKAPFVRKVHVSGRGPKKGKLPRWSGKVVATSACAGHASACRTGKSTFMHEMRPEEDAIWLLCTAAWLRYFTLNRSEPTRSYGAA